jgi:hypothetical protein
MFEITIRDEICLKCPFPRLGIGQPLTGSFTVTHFGEFEGHFLVKALVAKTWILELEFGSPHDSGQRAEPETQSAVMAGSIIFHESAVLAAERFETHQADFLCQALVKPFAAPLHRRLRQWADLGYQIEALAVRLANDLHGSLHRPRGCIDIGVCK